jgi:uncharacterized protein
MGVRSTQGCPDRLGQASKANVRRVALTGFLLDANALIALGWPSHEHHQQIHEWFKVNAKKGWATTPFTQAAFVRVISQPAFSNGAIGPREAAELLTRSTSNRYHSFLALDIEIAEVIGICTGGLMGHRQLTDAYLLASAMKTSRKLLTFDSGLKQLLATDRERATHITILGKGLVN